MSFKINPFTGAFDEVGSGGGSISTPVSIANGGTNNTTYTNKSVIYYDGTKLAENNTDFFWNNTDKTLVIGANGAPTPGGLTVTISRNGIAGPVATNANAGTAAQAGMLASNGTAFTVFTQLGTAYTGFAGYALISQTSGNGLLVNVPSAKPITLAQNASTKAGVPVGGGFFVSSGADLLTSATDGFLYAPSTAGIPAGTPTSITGSAPLTVDTTNNTLYFYSGGAWRSTSTAVTATTATLAANTISPTVISSFTAPMNASAANGLVVEYSMLSDNGDVRSGTVNLAYNTSATISALTDTYGETAALNITLSTDVSGGNVRLLYTNGDLTNNVALKGLIKIVS